MNDIVQALDSGNLQDLTGAGALIRSAWEDLLQARREHMAGKQRSKLDKRSDDQRARLLTAEEEAKISQARSKGKGKGGWTGHKPNAESSGRDRR